MGERKQVNIYYHDFESDEFASDPSQHELQVRLVERELLTDKDCEDQNCMFIDWLEKGKIYWTEDMEELDLMIQFKLIQSPDKYVGSISFPFRSVFGPGSNFKQWFTIFDTLEDDVFDGNIGDDDDEKPRLLIGFEIRNHVEGEDESQQSSVNELSMTKSDRGRNKLGTLSEQKINVDKLELETERSGLMVSSGGKMIHTDRPIKKISSDEVVISDYEDKLRNLKKATKPSSPKPQKDQQQLSGWDSTPSPQISQSKRDSSEKTSKPPHKFETPPKPVQQKSTQSPSRPSATKSRASSAPKNPENPKTPVSHESKEALEVRLSESLLENDK